MACYRPLEAWYSTDGETRGKIVFNRLPGRLYVKVPLPCGKCVGCRLNNAREWAIRCMHEAELHDDNCMVTLTYDEKHLPNDGSLRPRDVVLWMKRLRKIFTGKKISFFLAGEYGDKNKRPHYHVLIFGLDFQNELNYSPKDLRPTTGLLRNTWALGNVDVAPLNYETASYVARYCLKKQDKEINYVDKKSGIILQKEFTRMSRRPAIGKNWLEKNYADTYKDDKVIAKGNQASRPPRYYDKLYKKLLERDDKAEKYDEIKRDRVVKCGLRIANNTDERLRVREIVKKVQINNYKRSYEND